MQVEEYDNLIAFIRDGELRGSEKNDRDVLRRKAVNFICENDMLFFVKKGTDTRREVVKEGDTKGIRDQSYAAGMDHDMDAGDGHGWYYWRGIQADVDLYLKSCHQCQMNRVSLGVSTQLRPIRPPHSPCSMYGIDLIKLPTSHKGNNYAVVAIDYLTKYPIARAIPQKTAKAVADFLIEDLISLFGVPRVMISDQGTEFNNKIGKELASRLKIDHRLSTPYHPQTNGLVERMNRTVKELLTKSITDVQAWDEELPLVLMSIRSHVTRSTGYSAFELLTGHKMRWPEDVEGELKVHGPFTDAELEEFLNSEEDLIKRRVEGLKDLIETRQTARENILTEQGKYKDRYDRLHKPRTFNVGDLVTLTAFNSMFVPRLHGEAEPDGNCGYRSLAQCLFGPGSDDFTHMLLRKYVCDFLTSQSQGPHPYWMFIYSPALPILEHIDKMRKGGEWIGSLELNASAVAFGINILVYSSPSKTWVPYCGTSDRRTYHCLIYHDGSHFSPIYEL
uniref:RNA-directed DNA polymerase n=1 Tax=Steinernema glaseri TaxID=37863 RepID=A0A1I7YTG7_9BILA